MVVDKQNLKTMKNKLLIYYKALEIAEDLTNNQIGLCHFLTDAVCRVNHNLIAFEESKEYSEEEFEIINNTCISVKAALKSINNDFPEIAKYCPEKPVAYWFAFDDRDSRIAILKQAIVEYKIELYSKALEFLGKEPDSEMPLGFCHVLCEAILAIEADMTWEEGLDSADDYFANTWYIVKYAIKNETPFMPEFIKYKPKETCGNYWFVPTDREVRINILKEIIQNLQSGMEN